MPSSHTRQKDVAGLIPGSSPNSLVSRGQATARQDLWALIVLCIRSEYKNFTERRKKGELRSYTYVYLTEAMKIKFAGTYPGTDLWQNVIYG